MLQVVTTLQKTDAAYKAAPNAGTSGRKDLAADGFKKIMVEFEPISAAIKPYMDKYAHGKKSWAFWSGKPSVELAKKHGEVCLEKSALGGLFDNINISGCWDIQMWASLSKAYATHAASHVGDAKYSGFVGLGSSADQSIFNKIEQPQFVGMLSEKQKVDLKIDWYAGACNPENINQPDYRFKAGSIDGVYAKGDRAAMVDKAETENKRRIDLFKEKGINEGPNGTEGDKKDEKKPVGARVAFTAHGETHTQFIDENGTPTVASTPTAVKAKIEEWRPRLQQLTDEQQKRAGQLISKAISTEKKVAELAGQVKSGKAQDTVLEGKQRELADTLAQLWELMAPDMDPNKPFAEQDPKSTLKSDQYKQFKSRFLKLATDLDMPGGDAKAQEVWMKVVEALQKTDAAYKAAPSDAKSGRKDLAADGFKKIMEDFDPITNALKPYMEKYAHGKKSWAFWSGKPSVELAKKHAEVCLEKSALGGLFDNINISGGWDIQMWASLSKAYATHAAQHVGEAKYSGFVGMGSSAEQSIFNKIEQPQFVGMLSDKQKVDLKIDWYAGACNPENPGQPDYRFKAGSIDGVYAKGDRAAMVDKAETENKRRVDLFKEKGINEGPEGAASDKDKDKDKTVVEKFAMEGEGHTLTVTRTDKGTKVVMASKADELLTKIERGIELAVEELDKVTKAKKNAKKDQVAALGTEMTRLKNIRDSLRDMKKDFAPRLATEISADAAKELAKSIAERLVTLGRKYDIKSIGDEDMDLRSKQALEMPGHQHDHFIYEILTELGTELVDSGNKTQEKKQDDKIKQSFESLLAQARSGYARAAAAADPADKTFAFGGHVFAVESQAMRDGGSSNYVFPAHMAAKGDGSYKKYGYPKFQWDVQTLRNIAEKLINKDAVGEDDATMFIAALVAEPHRNVVAEVTNLLILGPSTPGTTQAFKINGGPMPMTEGETITAPRDTSLDDVRKGYAFSAGKVTDQEVQLAKDFYKKGTGQDLVDVIDKRGADDGTKSHVKGVLKTQFHR